MSATRLWRVTRAPYADLQGEGARRFGGRWNPIGTACAYLSSSLALAVLEMLVHTDPDLVPPDLVAVEVEVDGEVTAETAESEDLPAPWREEIGQAGTQAFGARWVSEARSALLVLPSLLLPAGMGEERNVLLNPAHPDAARVRIVRSASFSLDTRLLAG